MHQPITASPISAAPVTAAPVTAAPVPQQKEPVASVAAPAPFSATDSPADLPALDSSTTTNRQLDNPYRTPDAERDNPSLVKIWNVTEPWDNVTTVGFWNKRFYAGYRNQAMAFTGLILTSKINGWDQIVLQTLRHKDTYGTEQMMPHEFLFDVEHWNSHYPALPRLVRCDPEIFTDFDCSQTAWPNVSNPRYNIENIKKPILFGPPGGAPHNLFGAYSRYLNGKGSFVEKLGFPSQYDLLIHGGAFRPHPDIRNMVDPLLKEKYMTLHARVEPDMQFHPVCRDIKERNLTTIFQFLEQKWPEPPISKLFMPINRMLLEKGAIVDEKNASATNWIAVENLKALNHANEHGLWNGRVKVFEIGSKFAEGTPYEKFKMTVGAIINFYAAEKSTIFVGTEVSSFSADLARTRFAGGNRQNYYYRPDGLHRWTSDKKDEVPPGFSC